MKAKIITTLIMIIIIGFIDVYVYHTDTPFMTFGVLTREKYSKIRPKQRLKIIIVTNILIAITVFAAILSEDW